MISSCTKNGWEKATIETRRDPQGGYQWFVLLNRIDKKSKERETVRLEPHPAYPLPTVLEARHWAATYALYRVGLNNENQLLIVSAAMTFNLIEFSRRDRENIGQN